MYSPKKHNNHDDRPPASVAKLSRCPPCHGKAAGMHAGQAIGVGSGGWGGRRNITTSDSIKTSMQRAQRRLGRRQAAGRAGRATDRCHNPHRTDDTRRARVPSHTGKAVSHVVPSGRSGSDRIGLGLLYYRTRRVLHDAVVFLRTRTPHTTPWWSHGACSLARGRHASPVPRPAVASINILASSTPYPRSGGAASTGSCHHACPPWPEQPPVHH